MGDIIKHKDNEISSEALSLMVQASRSTGVKNEGEAYMVFLKAKELGIGAGNALSHIHMVNGKSGIDIHIIKAILSKPSNNITWKEIEYFKPIYTYTDGNIVYTYDTLPENYIVLNTLKNEKVVNKHIENDRVPVVPIPKTAKGSTTKQLIPVDYITTYEFKRIVTNSLGQNEVIIKRSSFKWSEAIQAGLPLDKDGNFNTGSAWYKYKKLMLAIRAFTFGARDIASDLLLGNYETSELMDIYDKKYDVDEEGKVTILKDDTKK